GRADHRAERTGVDLVPPAATADRVQPRRAARGHDGDGRARVARHWRQTARGARRQELFRRGRRAAAMKRFLFAALALATAGPAAHGQSAHKPSQPPKTASIHATVQGIRRTVLPDAVRIVIEIDAEVPFHDERIADPARVFVDLPETRAASALADR